MRLTIFVAFLLVVACSALDKFPTQQEIESELRKCQRPGSKATESKNALIKEQQNKRDQQRPKSKNDKNGAAAGGGGETKKQELSGSSTDMKKNIVDTTGKVFEFLGHVGEGLDEAKFQDKTTQMIKKIQISTALALRQAHLRPANFNVQRSAKAMVSLAKTASKVLGAVGAITSFLGPIGAGVGVIFSLVSIFIPQSDPNEGVMNALKEGFEKINQRFDVIEIKLDNLELVIEKTAIYSSYKSNQDQLKDVMFKYRQFSMTPNKFTLQELQETCHLKDPQLALAWIHRNLLQEQIGVEFLPTVLKDVQYDRDKLLDWFQIILSDSLQASFLREVCIGVRFGQQYQQVAERSVNVGSTTMNRTDLFCAVNFGREETDRMLQDIVKKLDDVELELIELFDKVQLEKDLKQMIRDNINNIEDICQLPGKIDAQLKEKYYWINWWVALSSNRLTIKSLDGHYATAPVELRKTNAWLTVVGSEKDVVIPPPDIIHGDLIFWENRDKNLKSSILDYSKGFYDNIVKLELHDNFICQGWPNKVEAMKYTFFKENYQAIESPRSNDFLTKYPWHFFIYYKSRYLPNTLGCKGSSEELKKLKISRHTHCSPYAFKRVVENIVIFHESKLPSYNKDSSTFRTENQKTASDLFYQLTSTYSEFIWNVYITNNATTLTTCTDRTTNCVDVTGVSGRKMIVVWSTKCDVSSYVANEQKNFQFLQMNIAKLFNINELLGLTSVRDFIIDPQEYMKNRDFANNIPNAETISTYGNKIIIVSTASMAKMVNGKFEFVQGPRDTRVATPTAADKKNRIEERLRISYNTGGTGYTATSQGTTDDAPCPYTCLDVHVAFYEPNGSPSCKID